MTTLSKKIDIFVPHLGQGIESVEIALWHVKEGKIISKGEDLCELVTDKVSFNVPSPHTGTLLKQCLKETQSASIGDPLAILLIS